jgi:hypothetical protein
MQHESEWGVSAILPDVANEEGVREAYSSCSFVMDDEEGIYEASLVIGQPEGEWSYAQASLQGSGWERLDAEGRLRAYQPQVYVEMYCIDPADPTEAVGEQKSALLRWGRPSVKFTCPSAKPQLVHAWCWTSAYW